MSKAVWSGCRLKAQKATDKKQDESYGNEQRKREGGERIREMKTEKIMT